MTVSKMKKVASAILLVAAIGTSLDIHQTLAAEQANGAEELSLANFDKVHKFIKPQAGESRWMEIPWLTNLWEARQKAAAEGKPIFVWSGSGGAPCAPT